MTTAPETPGRLRLTLVPYRPISGRSFVQMFHKWDRSLTLGTPRGGRIQSFLTVQLVLARLSVEFPASCAGLFIPDRAYSGGPGHGRSWGRSRRRRLCNRPNDFRCLWPLSSSFPAGSFFRAELVQPPLVVQFGSSAYPMSIIISNEQNFWNEFAGHPWRRPAALYCGYGLGRVVAIPAACALHHSYRMRGRVESELPMATDVLSISAKAGTPPILCGRLRPAAWDGPLPSLARRHVAVGLSFRHADFTRSHAAIYEIERLGGEVLSTRESETNGRRRLGFEITLIVCDG